VVAVLWARFGANSSEAGLPISSRRVGVPRGTRLRNGLQLAGINALSTHGVLNHVQVRPVILRIQGNGRDCSLLCASTRRLACQMPRTSESRWFRAPSSVLTAATAAAAAVAASRCELWLSRGASTGSDGTCHHVSGSSSRAGERREQLMLQQQQPSITAGRLAFVTQPRGVTPPRNCAASLELSRNRAAAVAVAVRGVSYDQRGISSETGPRRPRR
ncbi:unnamed protein product, partial [Laminaria digitata]